MKTFYKTVEQLKKEGYPVNQAVAIAYSHLRKQCGVPKDYKPGKMTPSEIVAYGTGKKEESLYPGVIAGDSLWLFYNKASDEEILEFENLIKHGKLELAVKLIEKVTGEKYPKFVRARVVGLLDKIFGYPVYILKERLERILDKLNSLQRK